MESRSRDILGYSGRSDPPRSPAHRPNQTTGDLIVVVTSRGQADALSRLSPKFISETTIHTQLGCIHREVDEASLPCLTIQVSGRRRGLTGSQLLSRPQVLDTSRKVLLHWRKKGTDSCRFEDGMNDKTH